MSMEPVILTTLQRSVRKTVYRSFLEHHRPPTAWEVGEELRCPTAAIGVVFSELADMRALVLRDDGRSIQMAMPFSADATPFRVTAGGRSWFASGAWNAFGIGALLAQSTEIASTCAATSQPLHLACDSNGCEPVGSVVHFLVPASRWWDDFAFTCATTLLFSDKPQVQAWCGSRRLQPGEIVPTAVVWHLAQAWYGDWLSPIWRARTTAEAQSVLDDVGLTSPFWSLTP